MVVALTYAISLAQFETREERRVIDARFKVIKTELLSQKTLSNSNADYLLKFADSPSLCRYTAVGLLIVAIDQGLFNRGKLLSVLEKQVVHAPPSEAELIANEYRSAMGLRRVPDLKFRDARKALGPKPADALDDYELRLINGLLVDKQEPNQLLAGQILVRKKGLDGKSLAWAETKVSGQIAKRKGTLKLYWQFILRALRSRNHKG